MNHTEEIVNMKQRQLDQAELIGELIGLISSQQEMIKELRIMIGLVHADATSSDIVSKTAAKKKVIESETPLVIHGQGEYAKKIYPSDL